MKSLLLPLLAALALPTAVNAFGKYPSSYEAHQACQKFRSNRKDKPDSHCKQEYNTRQIMYIRNYHCQNRKFDNWGKPIKCGSLKIIKRFRY